jgi:ABC-type Fe3+-hydroxamate transport system substrate-binding protein
MATFIDDYGQSHECADSNARIVSLVPSITELLYDLGLEKHVVGRTKFCIHPKAKIGRVSKLGGTKDVDLESLERLAPTHVILNIDENTLSTFESISKVVPNVIVTHPNTPEDNIGLYRLIGGIFNCSKNAENLIVQFEEKLARVKLNRKHFPERNVLYLIWKKPWMSVNKDTYIAGMLKLINCRAVTHGCEARYPKCSMDSLLSFDIDICMLSSEPYPFKSKHVLELELLLNLFDKVRLVDGEMFSWYGSRAILALDYMDSLIQGLAPRRAR